MDVPCLHDWSMSFREAVALQRELAGRVLLADCLPRPLRTVAGVDVSYEKHGDFFFAAVVVLTFPELEPVEEAFAAGRVTFPYVPGLLSFRELPVVIEAFRSLRAVPDAVLVDGQGIAHPRRLGSPATSASGSTCRPWGARRAASAASIRRPAPGAATGCP